MTSRERLIAAAIGEPVDTIPVSPRCSAYLRWRYGAFNLAAHLRFQKDYDQDLTIHQESGLVNPCDCVEVDTSYSKDIHLEITREQKGDVCHVRRIFHTPCGVLTDLIAVPPAGGAYGMSPNPVKLEFLLKEKRDLEAMKYILPSSEHCSLNEFFTLEEGLGQYGLVQLFIRGPVDHFAGDARGVENLMLDYYDDREFFDATVQLFADHVMAETKYCLERGIKHIFGSWYYTSLSTGWSPSIFREVFLPLMKNHVELVHNYGGSYSLYDDGKKMDVLADYISTGADVLETMTPPPVGDIDLAAAKKLMGNKMTPKGYTDLIYVLQRGDVKLVRDTVIHALETAAPGGRFILGTSDSIRENTPEENMATYFKTAREYGAKFLSSR